MSTEIIQMPDGQPVLNIYEAPEKPVKVKQMVRSGRRVIVQAEDGTCYRGFRSHNICMVGSHWFDDPDLTKCLFRLGLLKPGMVKKGQMLRQQEEAARKEESAIWDLRYAHKRLGLKMAPSLEKSLQRLRKWNKRVPKAKTAKK